MRTLFFLFFISSLTYAQSIRLGEVNEIKVFDGLQVTVIPSTGDSLVVEGKNKKNFSYKNKNGRLYLRMNILKRFSGFNTTVALFVSSPLEVIDANEGSFVFCEDVLFQPSITLKAQEGAEIEAVLDVQKLTTKTSSGGIVNIKGSATVQKHKVSAGGTLNGSTLSSSFAEINVKAGGKADIRASEEANAVVSFGGSVRVFGPPKKLVKRVDVGGTIELVKDAQPNQPNE
jgi:hypothetical protein